MYKVQLNYDNRFGIDEFEEQLYCVCDELGITEMTIDSTSLGQLSATDLPEWIGGLFVVFEDADDAMMFAKFMGPEATFIGA